MEKQNQQSLAVRLTYVDVSCDLIVLVGVYEIELSQIGKINGNPYLVCENLLYSYIVFHNCGNPDD